MDCVVGTLSASSEADLAAFVSGGGKLIIYDSECPEQDYSWLPYPFTTSNPGAMGGNGTLTIAEEDILASASAVSPHYIDAVSLGEDTDAVGDMNVMTTLDPNWCLSMSGTNAAQMTGPVHAYARYGSGLMIYNGLDVDYMGDESSPPYPNGLQKIWLQELQAPLNPSRSDLPCSALVIGTPTSVSFVRSATPTSTATSAATDTPVPVATSTPMPANTPPPPPPPPPPTATRPSGGAAGAITGPNTGSGPSGAPIRLGWLLLAVAMLSGGAVVSMAAIRSRRR